MQLPRLKIDSQQARIAIQQSSAQMKIQQPKAEMNLHQPKADLQIQTSRGKLNIDQSKAFAETNLKSALRWNEEYAQRGKQKVTAGTARRARQGSQLLDIHLGGNAIAKQAVQNGHPSDKMMGLKYMPSPFSVNINYEPAKVNIHAQKNDPQLHVNVRKPEINSIRGQVGIDISQKASVHIHVES